MTEKRNVIGVGHNPPTKERPLDDSVHHRTPNQCPSRKGNIPIGNSGNEATNGFRGAQQYHHEKDRDNNDSK